MTEDDPVWHRAFGMLKPLKETERRIHVRVCKYLRYKYPKIRFISTLDGERFGEFQAAQVRALQWGDGAPDMLIFVPRGEYSGLALELKKETVFKQDGKLKAGEHLKEQSEWLTYLTKAGWYARFGCGYDECIKIIEEYFKL